MAFTGRRFGEGDDSGRSPDEVRIIKEMLAEDVDRFILDNRIDAPAARDLRGEAPHIALAVLDRGPLTSAANPSGALVGRIRDAKRGVLGGRFGALAQAREAPPTTPGGAEAGGLFTELDKFISESRLDQGAVMSLRAESKEVQDKVLAMGPLVNAVNPSAALMGRIRSVKMGVQTYLGGKTATPGNPPAYGTPATAQPPAYGTPALAAPPGRPSAIEDKAINDGAMKAIKALQGEAVSENDENRGPGLAEGAKPEDSRLNAEALRAIAAINADSGGPEGGFDRTPCDGAGLRPAPY